MTTTTDDSQAIMRAEDDGMIAIRDTRSPIVRAHTSLLDAARNDNETDEETDQRLEQEAA